MLLSQKKDERGLPVKKAGLFDKVTITEDFDLSIKFKTGG